MEALPEYSEDGVDLTLIRWMLSLTMEQRLQFVQDQANAIEEARSLIRKTEECGSSPKS